MTLQTSSATPHQLLWVAVAVLLVLWATAAGLRHVAGTGVPAALGDHLWEVRVSVEVEAAGPDVAARAAVPTGTDHIHIIGQRLNHPGWRQRFSTDSGWGVGRQMRLVANGADPQGFEIGLTVRQSATPLITRPLLRPKLSVEARERYLLSDPLLGLEHEIVAGEVNLLASGSQSSNEFLARIFNRARQLLPGDSATLRTVPEVLADGRAGVLERANVMIALCRAANIPARLVTGLVLTESTEARLHHWVEVYDDSRGWVGYDPLHGYQHEVPHNFLPFVKDRADPVEVNDAGKIAISYEVTNADEFLEIPTGQETGWPTMSPFWPWR